MNPTICIVDDTASQRLVLSTMLKNAGYSTFAEVASAAELIGLLGLHNATATPAADVLLLDISLPDGDGIELCRQIKSRPELHEIPIIIVSASTDVSDLEQAFEAGAIDYITKPVNRIELTIRVRSALRLKHETDLRKQQQAELAELAEYLEAANRVLIEQQKKSDRLLRTIYDLSQALHTSAEMSDSLDALIAAITHVIKYDAAEICLYEPQTNQLTLVAANPALHMQPDAMNPSVFDAQYGYHALLLEQRQGLLIMDTAAYQGVRPNPQRTWQGITPQAYLGLPLLLHDDLIGTIELVSRTPNTFTNDNMRFLQSLAIQASAILGRIWATQQHKAAINAEINELHITIDSEKRDRQVDSIVNSDFFQLVANKAQEIRNRKEA